MRPEIIAGNMENERPMPSCDLNCPPRFNPRNAANVEVVDQETFCAICQLQFDSEDDYEFHKTQKSHFVTWLKAWLNVNRHKCEEDKYGITIKCPELKTLNDNSFVLQTYAKSTRSVSFFVENNGEHTIVIRFVDFLMDMCIATIHDDLGMNVEGRESGYGVTKESPYKRYARLEPHTNYEFTLTCDSLEAGVYCIPLAFDFYLEAEETSFIIVRHFTIQFTTTLIEKLETPQGQKKKRIRPIDIEHVTIIHGKDIPQEPSNSRLVNELSLFQHKPSDVLRNIYKLRAWDEDDPTTTGNLSNAEISLLEHILDMFDDGLDDLNYSEYFSTLLHIEELQMEFDIRAYDIDNGRLEMENRMKHLYKLTVPGLRENRPSILRGDRVYVERNYQGNLSMKERVLFEGIVHRVENTTVTLGFDESFSEIYIPRMPFFIMFSFSRTPLRRMHQALGFVRPSHKPVLFPTRCLNPYARNAIFSNFTPFTCDRNIQINNEQKQAILHILNGSSRPAPYLLFGPPGTGKTMTLVEAIKQIWHLDNKSFILVCAPSNSACDTVTERLLDHIPPSQIMRLYAPSRDAMKISDKIKRCCNYNGTEKEFIFPDKSELRNYRILVMTLVCSGRLVQANFSSKHFTHVFIDEAGQSIEPECLIPITGLLNCDANFGNFGKFGNFGGTLVLAGDPRQLGPVLRSKITAGRVPYIRDSLAVSFLERLMTTCELYQRNQLINNRRTFDPYYLTKLVRNYRSHEAILALPNQLFYDGELIACADEMVVNSLCNWEHLPRKNCPLIFHGVMGREKKENQSPSFFNPEEINVVMDYVKNLLDEKKVQPRDIGIISPYRKQVEKIKWALEENRRSGITVGSTEEFQGQERRVIIISTVRSTYKVLASDFEIRLGFLKNEKRFNVAITRAKALLIVIGNPYLLTKDQQWGAFLNHCKQQGAYTGCRFSKPEDAADDIYDRFERLNMIPDNIGDEDCVIPISNVEELERPAWPLVTE